MNTNPKENRIHTSKILIEEFQRKGYQCKEVKENDATILYLTHEKKGTVQKTEFFPQMIQEPFKKFLGFN
jgi:hypothetical protein